MKGGNLSERETEVGRRWVRNHWLLGEWKRVREGETHPESTVQGAFGKPKTTEGGK